MRNVLHVMLEAAVFALTDNELCRAIARAMNIPYQEMQQIRDKLEIDACYQDKIAVIMGGKVAAIMGGYDSE